MSWEKEKGPEDEKLWWGFMWIGNKSTLQASVVDPPQPSA